MNSGQRKWLPGSLTVEMTMLFPLCFLILVALMSTALGLLRQLAEYALAEEAMTVCLYERKAGATGEEAMQQADGYLTDKAEAMTETGLEWQWEREEGFLQEAFSLSVEGEFHLLTGSAWTFQLEEGYLDPAVFRNRVDLVVEVIKEVKDES